MKRIRIKLSEGTESHLQILTDDLLKDMKNKGQRELKWIIRDAFTEGIIHCADLHLKAGGVIPEGRKSIATSSNV